MARQGRFGRLPRRAPDLTSAIVAMMREYWNTMENIMVSSWREGGEVDGKQVTDEALLKFWLERRDSVQEDDPLWDYYDQQHDQYKFAIDESKVGLKYAQHKMSAKQVAQWYKGQSDQFAVNSEMYRTVMGQAAKFLDAAKADARASSAERRQKAYVRLREQSAKDYGWPTDIVMGALTTVLQGYGVLVGPGNGIQLTPEGDITGEPGGEGLTSMNIMGDVEQWDEILGAINTPGSKYYDWFQTELGKAKRDGLDIDAPFDQTDIDNIFRRALDGIDHDIKLAQRFHDVANKSDLPNLYAQRQEKTEQWQFVRTMDEANIYAQNRKNLNDVLYDPSSDAFAQLNALNVYYGANESLQQRLGDQNPLFSSMLAGEQRALLGDPGGMAGTIWEGGLQSPWMQGGVPGGGPEGDANGMAGWVNHLNEVVALAADGDHVLQKDKDGIWQAVTYADINAATGGAFVIVPVKGITTLLTPAAGTGKERTYGEGAYDPLDPDQGLLPKASKSSITVSYGQVYSTTPIIARAQAPRDPATGTELGTGPAAVGEQNIGMVTYLPDGEGKLTVPIYGIYANGGELRWTTESPFRPGTVTSSVRSNINGQDTLVVTADPTMGGALTYYIKQPDGKIVTSLTPPAEGSQSVVQEIRFNQQSIIDPMKQRSYDPTTFMDPGLAYMTKTQPGRETIAGWTPEEVFNSFKASPWIKWNNPTSTSEFWQDISAIKTAEAAAKSPGVQARYSSEWAFYQQVQSFRGGDLVGNNMWHHDIMRLQVGAIASTDRGRAYIESRLRADPYIPGSEVINPLPTAEEDKYSQEAMLRGGQHPQESMYAKDMDSLFRNSLIGGLITNPLANTGTTAAAATAGAGAQPSIRVPGMPGAYNVPGGPMSTATGSPNQPGVTPIGPRPGVAPTAYAPPGALPPFLPPAPNPNQPQIPGVSNRPRIPHEWDPFGPAGPSSNQGTW